MKALQHLTDGSLISPLGCSKMLAKLYIWLMVTIVVGALVPAHSVCVLIDCSCCNPPDGQRGDTFPIVTIHRCCSGDCDSGVELIGAYSCSCEISAETAAIDSAPKLSLKPDLLVASRQTPERVESRLNVPLTRGVEPIRKCSWQAFASVWRK